MCFEYVFEALVIYFNGIRFRSHPVVNDISSPLYMHAHL